MIIGIDGYAGAGKDTVADIFVSKGLTKVSFADELRETVVHATGFDMSLFLDRSTKDKDFKEAYILSSEVITKFCNYLDYGSKSQELIDELSGLELKSPRHILQFMGTEVGRQKLHPLIWIDRFRVRIAPLGSIVSPDARFSNERDCVKDLGGTMFWVDRESVKPKPGHISENDKWSIDKYDVVVYNNNGIFELKHELGLWWSLKGSVK